MIALGLAVAALGTGGVVLQGEPLPDPGTGPDEAQRTAEDILSQFSWGEPERNEGWLASVARAIGNAIEAVVGALFGSGLLTVVIWAVLIGLVAWVVLVVARRWRTRPAKPEPEVRVRALESSRSPGEWRSEAEELEARGEWKLGLRARYRALVSELISAGHLRDVPGRTTGEFRIELADSLPTARREFTAATDLFERAWYGDRATGPTEAAEFERCADGVLGRVPA